MKNKMKYLAIPFFFFYISFFSQTSNKKVSNLTLLIKDVPADGLAVMHQNSVYFPYTPILEAEYLNLWGVRDGEYSIIYYRGEEIISEKKIKVSAKNSRKKSCRIRIN